MVARARSTSRFTASGRSATPEVLAEFKKRVIKRLASEQRAPAVDQKRIAELEDQVANLAEAIATCALKSSPALASRLSAAEGAGGRGNRLNTPRPRRA
jgi:hypothetical protein